MLFLSSPYDLIEGLAVFADHASDTRFHFLPAIPKLSTTIDAAGQSVPQLQLIVFRGEAGTGGFLTFQVDLGVDDERLERVKSELRRVHQLRDEPMLSPVLLEGGTVELVMLGAAFDEDGKPIVDADGQQRFIVRRSPSAPPALYGDNQAIFSVELDQDGVQLVEDSLLHSALLPIGVVYSLDFYALRPAFSVRIHAEWDRVQKHLEDSVSADILFSSVEIDTIVDELIETQVVTIEVDSFLPEGEEGGSWVGRRDQAVKEFKDMVLQNFFKPSIEPVREEKDGWDRLTDTAERLSTLAVTGGWAGVAKFSYVKKDVTRIDQKRADLTMNERVTVKRSIYPQATLKGLGQGVDASSLIRRVDLDDVWFDDRTVKAYALVNFAHDRVASVNLTLTYDGVPRTIRLTKEGTDGTSAWNSLVTDGRMVRDVAYEYRVTFDGVDTGQRPAVLLSGLRTTIGDEFDVSPRAEGLYFLDDIQIGASALPWDRYPQVAVEVRYSDPANAIRLAETFVLTKERPESTWSRFRRNAELDAYEIRVTFLSSSGRDVLQDWTTTNQERLVIRDPHPLRRAVTVVPAVDWRLVAMIFVELRYVDQAGGVDEEATLSFFDTDSDRGPKTFTINLVNGEQRLVGWSATFVLKDNRTIVVPPSMTAGATLVLRTDMVGHRVVSVRPPDGDFAARGITRLEVGLRFDDAEAGLHFADAFTFTSAQDQQFFEYDYVAAERSTYSCTVRTVYANGLVQERDLGRFDADRLVLPVI